MYHGVTQKSSTPDDTSPASDARPAAGEPAARKERVLHTRIPAVLEAELKRFAENMRVPVSNLVRSILEDALEVADLAGDRVEASLRGAAQQVARERGVIRERLRRLDPLEGVLAFQAIVLAQPAACARCGVELLDGADAWLGITQTQGARIIVCGSCTPHRGVSNDRRSRGTDPQEGES